MRIFTRMKALITFCVGAVAAYAQPTIVEVGTNITSTDELTEGKQIAFYNTGRSLYIYNGSAQYDMGNAPTPISESSATYIWTVEKLDNGKYKFKDNSGKYMPVLGSGSTGLKGNDDGDEFTVTAGANGKWQIQGTDNNYFNGNGLGQGFCGWKDTGGNSLYEIRTLTIGDLKDYRKITVKQSDTNGNILGSENKYVNTGSEFAISAPTLSFFTHSLTKVNGEVSEATTITVNENTDIEYIYTWTLPFESSNITGSEFPADTKWYLLRLRDSYVVYSKDNETKLTGTSSKNYGDEYWWAFSGNATDGIKVYNKAAGASKIMTSISPSTSPSSTYPHFEDEASLDDTKNEIWTIYPSSDYAGNNGFYLSRKGETTKINLNQGTQELVYWTNQDLGSTFRVTPFNDEYLTLQNNVGEPSKRGAVNALNQAAYENFKSEMDKNSIEGFRAALAIAQAGNNTVAFNPNLLYRIENLVRKYSTGNGSEIYGGGYLEAVDLLKYPNYRSDYGYFSNDRNASSAQAIWKFESNGTEGQYYLHNMNAGTYISGTVSSSNNYLAPGKGGTENATAFTLNPLNYSQYNIKKAGVGQRLHASGLGEAEGAAVMLYDGGDLNSASAWYLIPANSIDLTISEAGYATANYPFAVQVPENVKAYIGTADAQKGVFNLKEVESGIIPAYTPVILEGKADTYSLTILADNNDEKLAGNDLNGSTVFKTVETDQNAYILGRQDNNHAGFYQMAEDDRTLPANKAYLVLPTSAKGVRSVIFSDGETTGIDETVAETAAEEYYDLQGRRVMNPTKGIYVTKSGKKVFINK